MISSRVRHNKTHPNGHHDVHARQTRDRRGKNRQNFYLQPEWRSSAVPVQPFMSRVGRVSDGTCTKRKMFDLPRTPNTNEERESGTGVSSSCFPSSPRAFCPVMARRNCSKPLDLRSAPRRKFQPRKRLGCPPVHQKQQNTTLSDRGGCNPLLKTYRVDCLQILRI